ncbi:hypothetical protein B0J14DRAFT_20586 [Halenospora varia]|nr:hypothetical protein B0J14DRAFT_20586 [Halenospora varia]
MGAFGTLSMGSIFGVVLGCLIVLAIGAGLIKVQINKRRTKKHMKLDEVKAKGIANDEERLNQREMDEGDLFGVRALEAGYFGGVAQSRPSSPTPSTTPSYKLSPSTTVVNWGDRSTQPSSANSSTTDLANIAIPKATKTKPSPLRAEALDADLRAPSDDTASVGGKGGAYMPPQPSSRSQRSESPALGKPAGWVSPLDVHFSRPTTPSTPTTPRPTSYLPKLNFPDSERNALLVPTPGASGIHSEAASIIGSDISASSKTTETPAAPVPIAQRGRPLLPSAIYQDKIPSPAARNGSRSIFPASDTLDERPSSPSSPNAKKPTSPTSPIPAPFQLPSDPDLFSEDDRPWDSKPNSGEERAVIRDSIVSKQRVSVYRPSRPSEQLNGHAHMNSITASSMYSIQSENPIIPDFPKVLQSHARNRSRSVSTANHSRNRSRSTSTGPKSHSRSSSVYSIARTMDSVRHARKHSAERDHRRSRDRDQIHFDPSSNNRNRSGSVQGRAVDFDHPRESPFSNANAASNHSASSSASSFESAVQKQNKDVTPKRQPGLAVSSILQQQQQPDRLSVAPSMGRGRSASEASQNSIGDFYDSYYRQSIVAQRISAIAQNQQAQTTLPGQVPNGEVHPSLRRGSDDLVATGNESGQWIGGMNVNSASAKQPPRGPMNFNGPRGPPPQQGPNAMNGGRVPPPARGLKYGGDNTSEGEDFGEINMTVGRRAPPPTLGFNGLAGQTIKEMPSPGMSPPGVSDRFPGRI